jgi:hypothetical protein
MKKLIALIIINKAKNAAEIKKDTSRIIKLDGTNTKTSR